MTSAAPLRLTRLSYVLPAHNAQDVLESSVVAIVDRLRAEGVDTSSSRPSHHEVIIVENASTDATADVAVSLSKRCTVKNVDVIATSSERGMGHAYRRGMELAGGELVLLTAADLPFGFSDLDAYLSLPQSPDLAVGSKGHPRSAVEAPLTRRLMSFAFYLLRRGALGLTTRDTQGTVFIRRTLAHTLLPHLTSTNYLISTEIIYMARQLGIEAVELPVVYPRPQSPSTVSPLRDSMAMAVGLVKLRQRRPPADVRVPETR